MSSKADAAESTRAPKQRDTKLEKRAKKAASELGRRKGARPISPAPTTAPAVSRPPIKRRIAAKLTSTAAMAGVGLMIVATSIPANAFYQEPVADIPTAEATEAQALAVSSEAATAVVARDAYSATSLQDRLIAQYGSRSYHYSVSPAGAVQWPFPFAAPISSGFGPRASCGYCSSWHLGIDFIPGAGTPIHAIANGIVSEIGTLNWGWGHYVVVQHNINGQRVDSLYAHMQAGTINVALGQEVAVGAILGQVGSTGASTGAHLHLEIHLDGVPVDPYDWLVANAG